LPAHRGASRVGEGESQERVREREGQVLKYPSSDTRHDLICSDLMVQADWRLGQKENSS
jgi:hypothetical protein